MVLLIIPIESYNHLVKPNSSMNVITVVVYAENVTKQKIIASTFIFASR